MFEYPSVSGIEEQSVHLSRAAIEPRIYHPNAKSVQPRLASGLLVRISIGCPKSEVGKESDPKVRSYHNVHRGRSQLPTI